LVLVYRNKGKEEEKMKDKTKGRREMCPSNIIILKV
jgi:hypothetical protein